MQNSGLGYCLNVLTSFNLIYRVPVLLIVSWRGHDDTDAVEHDVIGRQLLPLLELFGLPHELPWTPTIRRPRCMPRSQHGPGPAVCRAAGHRAGLMLTLTSVVHELLDRHPDACLVASCGYPSRELFGAGDRPANFYLVGSMGMAGPVALGLATVRPDRLLVALDGDGSLLMNLGVLPMIAASRARLLHLVIDNGMHESTGGQQTVQRTDFAALALAAGYRSAARISRPGQLTALDTDHTPLAGPGHHRATGRHRTPGSGRARSSWSPATDKLRPRPAR